MRDILFRGIDKKGIFVYGDLRHFNNEVRIVGKSGYSHIVEPETVGQFTGLTDKKGVKIFEGDILQDVEGFILVVKFGRFIAGEDNYGIEYIPVGFYILFSDHGTYCINSYGDGYAISANECSIVGNIHDNP